MKSWYTKPQHPITNNSFTLSGEKLTAAYTENNDIQEYLNSLYNLDNVPITNLIPDSEILPPESLRYFHVDTNWLGCLLDGALSIGRISSIDITHDKAVIPEMTSTARQNAAFTRRIRHNRTIQNTATDKHRTGFLLNSALVRGWPDLEVECYGKEILLPIIKFETIGDSILFIIADGIIDKIILTEPMESLFFGVEEEKGSLFKRLKSLKKGEEGKDIHTSVPLKLRDDEKKLINIKALTEDINQTLKEKDAAGDYFSSLEFALQMLREQTRFTIEIQHNN